MGAPTHTRRAQATAMTRWLLTLAAVGLSLASARAAEPVDYARDVKPILRERCYACHGALKQKAKLRLDTAALATVGGKTGPAIDPGKPAASLLMERVGDPDERTRMPPEGKPLTAEQIALIKAWIEQGAKAPKDEQPEADPAKHWAFQPVRRPDVPKYDRLTNPIDAFLAAEWEKRGLKPVGETDKATLLRRVYLDLVGIPPAREELHAFLKDDAPDAYEKVVDKLLASPAYGERWGRRWMDVWRYSDWYGRRAVPDVLNSYGQVWRWRDWIVRSVNSDRGYDAMVQLMLAADELAPTNLDDSVATAFVVRNFFRWNYNNWMRDNVEHTAKAFLGLTLNCCHCHDHKYDPVTQEEYFKFRAVFEPIEIRHDRWPGEADPGVYPKYSYGGSYKPITSGMVRVMDERLDAKTHFYTGGDERNVSKDRAPVPPGVPAALGGTFSVEAVNLPPESWYPGLKAFVRREEADKRTAACGVAADALEKVMRTGDIPEVKVAEAKYLAALSELAALKARIAADDVKYLGAPGDPKAATAAASKAERKAAFDAARVLLTQTEVAVAVAKQGKDAAKVTAAEKAAIDAKAKVDAARKALDATSTTYTPLSAQYPKTSTGRRAALAKWITSADNPLTARVAVNHIWAGHFGRPLVETTSNFGRSGKAPTHPELLDWLAAELVNPDRKAGGEAKPWTTKHLHRLIVTSRAYRMSSRGADSPNVKPDADNVYLWRFPTNRLEAEAVRDSLLAVAGELDAAVGGPEVPQDQGLVSRRRSLYFAHHGEARMEFLDLFDAANPCDAYRRTASVLPQQALALTNSDLAQRDADFVRAAFETVLCRPPRDAEAAASATFLANQRELFAASAAELKAAPRLPGGPSADPIRRARENLILALFSHTDFVTVR
jgi:mono/diheme cytochrome c family protein